MESFKTANEKHMERAQFMRKIDELNVNRTIALAIYDRIGQFSKIERTYIRWPKSEYLVDDKYIVKTNEWRVISVQDKEQYDAERKAWGKRIRKIAEAAGTSFDMATVVANIEDIDKSIDVLKTIVKELNKDNVSSYIYSIPSKKAGFDKRFRQEVKNFLYWGLPSYAAGFDFYISKKFLDSVAEILENKRK